MKKFLTACIFASALLFASCISASVKEFNNLDIEFEETQEDYLVKATISGFKLTSALSIDSYQVEYKNNKVFVKINEKLKNTGMSMHYHIQFLMGKSVNEIYIGKELFWTSSVKSYFKGQNFNFPLNVNKSLMPNKASLEGESNLSEAENKDVKKFMEHFSKEINFEKCKKWNGKALAFNIYDFGIYEDAGKKYFCVSVKAYTEKTPAHDRAQKIKNTDITVLHNIMLFDYNTYEEKGWVL